MKIIYMSAAVGIILFIVLLLLIGGGGFFAWSYGYVGGQIIGGECEENDDCRNENCIEEKCRNIDLAVGKKCDDDNRCKDDLFCSSAKICTAIPSSSPPPSISPGTLGDECDTSKPCASTLVCTAGRCAATTTIQPGTVGDDCDTSKPCASTLVCTGGKCAASTSTNTPVGTSGKLGESCANVACDTGLICGGTSKKCENPPVAPVTPVTPVPAVNYIKFDDIDFPAFSYMGKPIEILGLKPVDNYMALCNADLDCGGFNASSGFLFDKNTKNPIFSKGALTYKKMINPSEYIELNNIDYPITVAGGGENLGMEIGDRVNFQTLKERCDNDIKCDGFAITSGNLGFLKKLNNEKPLQAPGSKFYRRK
jgi:hypothetical protein